jgi:hypothetical protein
MKLPAPCRLGDLVPLGREPFPGQSAEPVDRRRRKAHGRQAIPRRGCTQARAGTPGVVDTFRHELAIYLNDHLAGATGGVELARRIAHEHEDAELTGLARDIEQDRDSLLRIMASLGVRPDQVKVAGGWLGEKLGRLKPNGRLFSRSPLSHVIELEAMRLGVDGKAAGWQTLRRLADHDDRLDRTQLDELLARARSQKDSLENARVRAVEVVFVEPGGSVS